jgi:uncharacterized protein YjiS (DUF1127 family)
MRAQVRRWAGLFRDIKTGYARDVAIRHDAVQLNDLSDHLLRDLGLNRSDIANAVQYGRSARRRQHTDWF